jgi:hypothetical protein
MSFDTPKYSKHEERERHDSGDHADGNPDMFLLVG